MKINCGIDLIRVSISDGIEGFKACLDAHDGSFGHQVNGSEWEKTYSFHYKDSNYELTYNRGHKLLYVTMGGLTQYSDTSKAFGRWDFLQVLHYHYQQALKVNEIHFAVDVPYRFADITVHPKDKVYQPHHRSVKYFDIKRQHDKHLGRDDDFVIYDKCRKCRIGTPLTRIELRLKLNQALDVINHEPSQKKIINRVIRKFNDLKIKKGRSIIKLHKCDWEQVLSDSIQYVANDISMSRQVFKHRDESIEETGKLFKNFMQYCREYNIYSSKPQHSPKAKPFLNELTPQQTQILNRTIASYNAYDNKWYQDPRFKMKAEQAVRTRLTDERRDEILFMVQQGQTQSSIAEELNVSESTISRWLHGYVWLRDSKMLDIISVL